MPNTQERSENNEKKGGKQKNKEIPEEGEGVEKKSLLEEKQWVRIR